MPQVRVHLNEELNKFVKKFSICKNYNKEESIQAMIAIVMIEHGDDVKRELVS